MRTTFRALVRSNLRLEVLSMKNELANSLSANLLSGKLAASESRIGTLTASPAVAFRNHFDLKRRLK